jgi:hypothetical protein
MLFFEQPEYKGPSPLLKWWQRTLKPILGGSFGGFLLTMAVMAVMEACGVPFEGPHQAPWADSVIALTWMGSAFALYYLLRLRALGVRWPRGRRMVRQQTRQAQPDVLQERMVNGLVRRIDAKARRLQRQAGAAGVPYAELVTKASELAEQARQLAGRIRQLQSVAQTMATDGPEPVPPPPPGVAGPDGEMLRKEYEAVEATRRRLQELLGANRLQQQLCFTRLQRIGDLLDAAWVEVSQPVELLSEARTGTGIVQEVETELQAARDALSEVERSGQQEA